MKQKFADILKLAKVWGMSIDHEAPRGSEQHTLDVYRQSAGKHLLVGHLSSEQGEFVFRYDVDYTGKAISAFPDTSREYRSKRLWPFFAIRIPPFDREDMRNEIDSRSLNKEQVIEILGSLAKVSATNPYEFKLVNS